MSYRVSSMSDSQLRDFLQTLGDDVENLRRLSAQFHPGSEWQPIAKMTLGGSAASIDFTAIPQTFAHLRLIAYLRADTAAAIVNAGVRFNNDSGGNYDEQYVSGSAAAAAAAETLAATLAVFGGIPANTADANLFGQVSIDIANYANAAHNKTMSSEVSLKWGIISGNMIRYASCNFWRSNAAINRVTLLPFSGSFVAGSRATLYGLA